MSIASSTTNSADYGTSFPNSHKVYEERVVTTPAGDVTIRVPAREVMLSGGEPPVRLYDTSGPQATMSRLGLPKLREAWVAPRRGADA